MRHVSEHGGVSCSIAATGYPEPETKAGEGGTAAKAEKPPIQLIGVIAE
jgi:hypothetical protein